MRNLIMAAILAIAVWFGCTPAKSATNEPPARAAARSAIISIAYATKTAMDLCEETAIPMASFSRPAALKLAKACDDGYAAARSGLLAAQSAMDVWNDASTKQIACAARDAYAGLASIRDAVVVFAKVPQVVDDGLEMGKWAASLAGAICAIGTPVSDAGSPDAPAPAPPASSSPTYSVR